MFFVVECYIIIDLEFRENRRNHINTHAICLDVGRAIDIGLSMNY